MFQGIRTCFKACNQGVFVHTGETEGVAGEGLREDESCGIGKSLMTRVLRAQSMRWFRGVFYEMVSGRML